MARIDLIRRSDALDALQIVAAWSTKEQRRALSQAYDKLHRVCAVDAAPVVHGQWVKAHGMMPPEYHHRKQCSMCGGWALQDYFGRERLSHYCPNCGAKMDGGAT